MSKIRFLIGSLFCCFFLNTTIFFSKAYAEDASIPVSQLSLGKPAGEWIEGLPLGNGITAAMVWGEPSKSVLALNHVDFWRDHLGKDIDNYSKEIRQVQQLMLAGKAQEANDLYYKTVNKIQVMPRQKTSYPILCGYTNSFQPIGNLNLELDGQTEYTEYHRTLDLNHGVGGITYNIGDNTVVQKYFIPAREDVIVVRVTSEKPVSGGLSFERPEQAEYHWTTTVHDNQLTVQGVFDEGVKSFVLTKVKVNNKQGSVAADVEKATLEYNNATDFEIYIAIDSGKGNHDCKEVCQNKINAIADSFDAILAEHKKEHSRMFNRVEFALDKDDNSVIDTDVLIQKIVAGQYDPRITELSFQMGRYLMMSTNRTGRRPANLQGIWNAAIAPEWDADWHTDMNIEMNQWLANPTNLDECNLALFRQLELIVEQGKRNARQMTDCDGILFYGLIGGDSNIWCAEGGFWTGAAAWLAQHFWTHYEYTLDKEFLAEHVYPFIKEVGLFYKDFLIKNEDGKYITGFSFSPENVPPNAFVNNIHCTMDTAMVREITRHLLEAGKILDVDQELWPVWQDLHDNILPYPVTAEGVLKEWPEPLPEQPAHRHFSHLYPLFPGDEFSRERTPELFEAARKAVQLREENRSAYESWSFPYVACFYARFGQGDQSLKNLNDLIRQNSVVNLLIWYDLGKRLFQIEAGFGATTAVSEMLLQSQQGLIRLLPALPAQWSGGYYKGLKARGAFVVDVIWKDGRIKQATITSLKGSPCKILCGTDWQAVSITSESHVEYKLDKENNVISFPTQPNKTYKLVFD